MKKAAIVFQILQVAQSILDSTDFTSDAFMKRSNGKSRQHCKLPVV